MELESHFHLFKMLEKDDLCRFQGLKKCNHWNIRSKFKLESAVFAVFYVMNAVHAGKIQKSYE